MLVEEQDLIADDACILAHLFCLPVFTCEGSLRTLLLCHVELKWREGLTIVFEHFLALRCQPPLVDILACKSAFIALLIKQEIVGHFARLLTELN